MKKTILILLLLGTLLVANSNLKVLVNQKHTEAINLLTKTDKHVITYSKKEAILKVWDRKNHLLLKSFENIFNLTRLSIVDEKIFFNHDFKSYEEKFSIINLRNMKLKNLYAIKSGYFADNYIFKDNYIYLTFRSGMNHGCIAMLKYNYKNNILMEEGCIGYIHFGTLMKFKMSRNNKYVYFKIDNSWSKSNIYKEDFMNNMQSIDESFNKSNLIKSLYHITYKPNKLLHQSLYYDGSNINKYFKLIKNHPNTNLTIEVKEGKKAWCEYLYLFNRNNKTKINLTPTACVQGNSGAYQFLQPHIYTTNKNIIIALKTCTGGFGKCGKYYIFNKKGKLLREIEKMNSTKNSTNESYITDSNYINEKINDDRIKVYADKNYIVWDKSIEILDDNFQTIQTVKNSISNDVEYIEREEDKVTIYYKNNIIQYYKLSNAKLLATKYIIDNDTEIILTPEGYFNASKNGAKHLNILTTPLTVTSIDAYYEKFYRPDIVKLALQGKTVDTGLKMSNIKPAPEVEIVGLPNKTTKKQIEITLKLKDRGGGIGDIRIYRNGTAISLESRTIQRSQQGVVTKKYTIPLEKGRNKIEAIAFEGSNSAKSEPPATVTVMANYTNQSKPSLHAVVIGIEEFRNQKLNLRYTKADATALKETLERYSKPLFDGVNVTLLTSKEETTKENISKVLTNLQSLNPNDMFLFFVASHGVVDDGSYYLITSNVGSTRTKKLKQDALSQEEITKLISNIPTGKKLIILDTCSAGALGDSIKLALLTRGMSEDTAIKILSRATGTTILSASLSTQQALEGYKGHGLFSYVLLEGLKKEADLNGDGFVKTPELVDYIDERVSEISKKAFGVEQFPTVNLDGRGFPVSMVE